MDLAPSKRARPTRTLGDSVSAAAAISFSLTFVCAGFAQLMGLLPKAEVLFDGQIDVGVVLLLVPLCALLLAILAEALRATVSGSLHPREPRPRGRLTAGRAGRREA